MDKKELINSGKVKSVYTTDNDDEVIIEFRDDMTAGDGERKEVMNNKGAYNAVISAKIFKVISVFIIFDIFIIGNIFTL